MLHLHYTYLEGFFQLQSHVDKVRMIPNVYMKAPEWGFCPLLSSVLWISKDKTVVTFYFACQKFCFTQTNKESIQYYC